MSDPKPTATSTQERVASLSAQLADELVDRQRAQKRLPALERCRKAAEKMLDDLDNATGPDEWSTSELRAAVEEAKQ